MFSRPNTEKIKPEDIPAATQLFTPHWIVRFMTENSLGRLWLHNRPKSSLKERMEYFVETDSEGNCVKVSDPKEIKVLDPACGSGHILVYAFDLLFTIYEEEGYTPSEIPSFILKNNLFGIDIDDRAAALASFALGMKAREKDRFFFEKSVFPNVIASQNVEVDLKEAGIRLSPDLQESFEYLKQAKNLGSLVPVPKGVQEEVRELEGEWKGWKTNDLFSQAAKENLLSGSRQVAYLCPYYHCVIMNPPYMGSKGMNALVKRFANDHFLDAKSDLFACFIERGYSLARKYGYNAMVTMQSWMFLSSFEKMRERMLREKTIESMAHLGARAFGSISGEAVQTTVFVLKNRLPQGYKPVFFRLLDGDEEVVLCHAYVPLVRNYRRYSNKKVGRTHFFYIRRGHDQYTTAITPLQDGG